MRVKCLSQEHNTMSPGRARTRAARSGDERTNHEARITPGFVVSLPVGKKGYLSWPQNVNLIHFASAPLTLLLSTYIKSPVICGFV